MNKSSLAVSKNNRYSSYHSNLTTKDNKRKKLKISILNKDNNLIKKNMFY